MEAVRDDEEEVSDTASEVIARSLRKADEMVAQERRRNSEQRPKQGAKKRSSKGKNGNKKRKKSRTSHDTWIKSGSIILSLVMVLVMMLNMPILWYKKAGQPDERVSVIQYFKRWQPTVEIEGQLQQNTMDLKINTDVIQDDYTDGLDLPQLVEGQYSVLFVGFDESEQLTDVVWVCQFDIGNGQLNILQIPRDLAVPDYTSSVTCKFNSVYTEGDRYITPPIQRVVNAVQENFGIPIDAYITTACFDIADMVDLVGGIQMHVENEIMYEADKIIPEGDVTLSGEQAEWFVRFRREWSEGDIGRMKNQRKFMAAAMQKLLSIVKDEGRIKLYSYLNQVYKNQWIATDMSLEDLSKLADFASTLTMDTVRVNMVPGEGANYQAEDGMEYSFYSVHKYATITMLNQYYRPYQQKLKLDDVALVEYVKDYENRAYDDTGATLNEVEESDEPKRNEY
ncbi:MAG: LCP family protein [Ruminococcus sp.]|nr:LCP family protein [Ruminococcus sp.]